MQAAIVTTSGGLVGGDRLDIAVQIGPRAAAHVTASAAEKIYRSLGPTTAIRQSLTIGEGARLEFLPPETILFEGARLRRETAIELPDDAVFLGGDIIVFGRRARGERFTSGFLREVWEVRRAGRLVWGDAVHLDGEIAAIVDDPACFDGAAGFATMILAPGAHDPRSFLEGARAVQSTSAAPALRAGVTVVAGLGHRPLVGRGCCVAAASLCGARRLFPLRGYGIATAAAAHLGCLTRVSAASGQRTVQPDLRSRPRSPRDRPQTHRCTAGS